MSAANASIGTIRRNAIYSSSRAANVPLLCVSGDKCMRMAGSILAAAVLAVAPMAWAQTEAPPAAAEVSAPADTATPAEATTPAETTDAPPADAAAVAAPAEPELVCRTVTARTESRLRSARQRVCRTQAQWDAEERAARGGRNNAANNSN